MSDDLIRQMNEMFDAAVAARAALSLATSDQKNNALKTAARLMRERSVDIMAANEKDMAFGRDKGLSGAMLDRLMLDAERVEGIAAGLEAVAALPDPVGDVIDERVRPNGLKIERVRVPLGVIGVIYESRPNVTADAGALCLKAGNAAILRGGSESLHSAGAIHACLADGLREAGLPASAVQIVPTRDRAAVGAMLTASGKIDVIVPRGGKGLVARVQDESRVPVFAHLEGICHVYIGAAADAGKAVSIAVNAKMRRTGICGSAETLLIDHSAMETGADAVSALLDAGCTVRGDALVMAMDPRVEPATDADWPTEYLDAIISARVVSDIDDAMQHIATHGSGHTEAIITEDQAAADRFLREVDSAIVLHNASTQYADGGEFGMGAEIGISTGRIHARGPVGLEQLTSFKYRVHGTGQTRP